MFSAGEAGQEAGPRPEVRVGKLNTNDLFSNTSQAEQELVVEKPRMKIGKLDPNHIFDSRNKEVETEKDVNNAVVMGKLSQRSVRRLQEREEQVEPPAAPAKLKINVSGSIILQQ